MKYILIDNHRVMSVHESNITHALAYFRLRHSVHLVNKPPSKRTLRRWRQQGWAKATCGCKITAASGDRCVVHNAMSWLTVYSPLHKQRRKKWPINI